MTSYKLSLVNTNKIYAYNVTINIRCGFGNGIYSLNFAKKLTTFTNNFLIFYINYMHIFLNITK